MTSSSFFLSGKKKKLLLSLSLELKVCYCLHSLSYHDSESNSYQTLVIETESSYLRAM